MQDLNQYAQPLYYYLKLLFNWLIKKPQLRLNWCLGGEFNFCDCVILYLINIVKSLVPIYSLALLFSLIIYKNGDTPPSNYIQGEIVVEEVKIINVN